MLVKSSVELEQFHANLSMKKQSGLLTFKPVKLLNLFGSLKIRLRTANEQALIRLEQRTANTTENNTLYPKNKRQRKTEAASSAKATGSAARTDKRVICSAWVGSERAWSWRKSLSSDEVREPQAESACPERFRQMFHTTLWLPQPYLNMASDLKNLQSFRLQLSLIGRRFMVVLLDRASQPYLSIPERA
ncbi:hypothetical protein BDZ91DRAFT_760771 [Kalaharituber pfeilii]|nr:hypothetical protein BDZ91DRAFT_760771 [Kalaharituber pfeilii]